MSTGYRNASGVDFDALFDPYVSGTKPAATGYRTSDGVDLANRYAPAAYGSKGPNVGYRLTNGADLSTLWAAKGTATYALGFNGGSYAASSSRGTAKLTLAMASDGTWSVTDQDGAARASGTWLNFGGVVGDYSVLFTATGFTNGTDPGGGTDSYGNGATSASALTTTRAFWASAGSISGGGTQVQNNADNSGTLTVHLYKSGQLISTSSCTFDCSSSYA